MAVRKRNIVVLAEENGLNRFDLHAILKHENELDIASEMTDSQFGKLLKKYYNKEVK